MNIKELNEAYDQARAAVDAAASNQLLAWKQQQQHHGGGIGSEPRDDDDEDSSEDESSRRQRELHATRFQRNPDLVYAPPRDSPRESTFTAAKWGLDGGAGTTYEEDNLLATDIPAVLIAMRPARGDDNGGSGSTTTAPRSTICAICELDFGDDATVSCCYCSNAVHVNCAWSVSSSKRDSVFCSSVCQQRAGGEKREK